MWVVHSLNPSTDLKPADLRLRLIRHAEDPQALLRLLDKTESRVESELERLVARRLVERGYRVTPQRRVGYYRIDLLVEGQGKSLAVECDGDRYHPLEKLVEDMERQAILERQGWRFVRIRGSQFFRDPEGAMIAVFERLDALGIPPEALDSAQESGSRQETQLRDRVIRRAEEIRRGWAKPAPTNVQPADEAAQPDLLGDQKFSQGEKSSPAMESRSAEPQQIEVNRATSVHQNRNPTRAEKPSDEFRLGSRVRHPTFGDGVVLASEGEGAEAKLTIRFSRWGLKKLIQKYAALKALSS